METNHLSTNSIGSEKFNGGSRMKSESDESNIPRIQIYDETGRSVEVFQVSSISVQDESLKELESRSSVSTIGKDSASKSSFTVGDENLKTSESMLSFTSTTAICGSYSSDIASSWEEPFGNLEDINKKREIDNVDLTQMNDQQYEEIDNAGLTMGFKSKDQSEILEVQEKGTSACTIVKDSESNISSRVETENLKTSESMLSFNSTAAIYGSSSSDAMSSEEEPLGDFEDISEKREFTSKDVQNISSSPPPISFSVKNFGDESQTNFEFTSSKGSSLQEDSGSLKSQDKNNSLDEDISQSLPKERLLRNFKGDEFPSQKSLSSTFKCFSDIEDLSSNNYPNDVPPLVRNEPSLNTGEIETSDILYGGTTLGVVDHESNWENYFQEEDKPIRRVPSLTEIIYGGYAPSIPGSNFIVEPSALQGPTSLQHTSAPSIPDSSIKAEPLVLQGPTSLQHTSTPSIPDSSIKAEPSVLQGPTSLQQTSAPSIPDSSIKVEPSVLQGPKSLQQISPEEGDWDLYENCGRSAEVKCIETKPWVKEMISSWEEIANTDAARGVEKESLLKEVHNFIENKCADTSLNMNLKESKVQTTAKHFNDELSPRSRLHSREKLIKECLKDLEHYTSPNPKTEVELQDMCKLLIDFSIPEEAFIEFAGNQILMVCGRECDLESSGESFNKEPHDYFSGLRFSITEDFNFFVIVKLFKKLMYEGATFLSILDESNEPTTAKEGFRCREWLSKAQNSNPDLDDKSIVDCLPLNRRHGYGQHKMGNTGCSTSIESDVYQKEKSAIESSKQHLREPNNDESSNVVSVSDASELDSSVLAEDELSNEKTYLTLS